MPPVVVESLDELAARAASLGHGRRALLGIAGSPGAGKSTLAETLVRRLPERFGVPAALVAMDGFHLADAELERLGSRGRKGAIDTFDAWGYLALLRRLRAETDGVVYAPAYDRALHQPVAASLAVDPGIRLVITEGNYLLDADDPWPSVRGALDEVWYVDIDEALRRERLVARHVHFGRTEAEARRWVGEVDEPNARRVRARRDAADVIVDLER